MASDAPAPDECLEQGCQHATALAGLAALPPLLREPTALFYVHELTRVHGSVQVAHACAAGLSD